MATPIHTLSACWRTLHAAARGAPAGDPIRPLYLRLAAALSPHVAEAGGELPSARRLAGELGLNRATVTAAYRELSRQGLLVLRPGRPRRGGYGQPAPVPSGDSEPVPSTWRATPRTASCCPADAPSSGWGWVAPRGMPWPSTATPWGSVRCASGCAASASGLRHRRRPGAGDPDRRGAERPRPAVPDAPAAGRRGPRGGPFLPWAAAVARRCTALGRSACRWVSTGWTSSAPVRGGRASPPTPGHPHAHPAEPERAGPGRRGAGCRSGGPAGGGMRGGRGVLRPGPGVRWAHPGPPGRPRRPGGRGRVVLQGAVSRACGSAGSPALRISWRRWRASSRGPTWPAAPFSRPLPGRCVRAGIFASQCQRLRGCSPPSGGSGSWTRWSRVAGGAAMELAAGRLLPAGAAAARGRARAWWPSGRRPWGRGCCPARRCR